MQRVLTSSLGNNAKHDVQCTRPEKSRFLLSRVIWPAWNRAWAFKVYMTVGPPRNTTRQPSSSFPEMSSTMALLMPSSTPCYSHNIGDVARGGNFEFELMFGLYVCVVYRRGLLSSIHVVVELSQLMLSLWRAMVATRAMFGLATRICPIGVLHGQTPHTTCRASRLRRSFAPSTLQTYEMSLRKRDHFGAVRPWYVLGASVGIESLT